MFVIRKFLVLAQIFLTLHLCFCVPDWEPESKDQNWLDHHTAMLKQTADHKNDIKIVFLGDSITFGWLGEGKTIWNSAYVPLGAYNYGIGGDTTQNVIWRIQNKEFDGVNPKMIVLMIGTNNLNHSNTTAENISKGVKEVINELLTLMKSTKVLLLAVTPRNPGVYEQKVKDVNVFLAKFDDQKTTFYLDMSSHFIDANQTEITSLYVDGRHFTAAGYKVWHDVMDTLFKQLNA